MQKSNMVNHDGMSQDKNEEPDKQNNVSATKRTTRSQMIAVALGTVLALAAGVIISAGYTNLQLSARDVGGLIMPPGMIMSYDTPAQSMRDMAAVSPYEISYTAPINAKGDQALEPRIENGIKVSSHQTLNG